MTEVIARPDVNIYPEQLHEAEVPCDVLWKMNIPCNRPAVWDIVATCAAGDHERTRAWCAECYNQYLNGLDFACQPCGNFRKDGLIWYTRLTVLVAYPR